MHGRITDGVRTDEFGATLNLDMVLVSVEVYLALLCPAGITVFLAKLVRVLLPPVESFIPRGGNFSLFDLVFLVAALALFGYFKKRGIDNLAGFCEDTLVVKKAEWVDICHNRWSN